jgi:uracil-DNA glycosylase family protein
MAKTKAGGDGPPVPEMLPSRPTIKKVRDTARGCRACHLYRNATQTVFGEGPGSARIMFVGEQPGDAEDRQGVPFVGPAGKVLQRALAEAEIAVADVYVTNAVKHFRFTERGKRRIHATPQMSHIKACRPWLEAELNLVDPKLIVCLGSTAAKALLGSAFRVTQSRGQVLELETPVGTRRVLATVHPSSILRANEAERDAAYAGLVADLRVAGQAVA